MASHGTSDAIETTEMLQSCELRSTQSPSQARALNGAVDHVSEHRMALIKSRSGCVVGRHVDASDSPRRDDDDRTAETKIT